MNFYDNPNVTENIYKRELSDFPCQLLFFIKELQDVLNKIPKEFKGDASVEFESDYDGGYGELSINYDRPKTAQEIEEDKIYLENSKKIQEKHELALFERLKNKYGD